jgi:hypothetical protein
MEEELLEARALVTTYEVMEDNTQELERQNRNLKKYLTELAGEFHTYRDCTIFAVARARQYEAEFKAIQEEGDGYCASVERGAGSGERGFLILIFKISDNHGEGDLLPWP